jgi:hypothetical protein
MNRSECEALLIQEGVKREYFDLNGGRNDNTYTIGETYGKWYYYFFERGEEFDRREFATESKACEFLLQRIREDRAIQHF